jgi:uncharacterized protein (DUF2062 family)
VFQASRDLTVEVLIAIFVGGVFVGAILGATIIIIVLAYLATER